MRVMLISERTPKEFQHVIRYNALDFHVMGAVRETPGIRAADIVEELGVAPTTLSSVVARLIQRGVLTREKSAEDRRAFALHLSEEGAAIANAIHAQDLHNMNLFLSALQPEEQQSLMKLFDKITTHVAELEKKVAR